MFAILVEINPSQHIPQKNQEDVAVDNGGKNFFAQFMPNEMMKAPAESTAAGHALPKELFPNAEAIPPEKFLAFLQNKSMQNLRKSFAIPDQQINKNNNHPEFQQSPNQFNQPMGNAQGPLSVEELEARIRESFPAKRMFLL